MESDSNLTSWHFYYIFYEVDPNKRISYSMRAIEHISQFLKIITKLHQPVSDAITFLCLLLFHGNSCIEGRPVHLLIVFQDAHRILTSGPSGTLCGPSEAESTSTLPTKFSHQTSERMLVLPAL